MNRDEFDIMLSLAEGGAQPRPSGPHGVWDMYIVEIEVLDPDGYRICFGSE